MAQDRCTYCGNTVFLDTAGSDGSAGRTCAGPLGCGVVEVLEARAPRKKAA